MANRFMAMELPGAALVFECDTCHSAVVYRAFKRRWPAECSGCGASFGNTSDVFQHYAALLDALQMVTGAQVRIAVSVDDTAPKDGA
jgi:hypothetical protein